MHVFHIFNLDYKYVTICLSFFILTSIFYFIKKNTFNYNFAIGLFLLSIFTFLVVLLRTSYAIAFILLGFNILLNSKSKYKDIYYIILVIIGSCIHVMCILYLLYFIPYKVSKRKLIKLGYIYFIISVFSISFIATGLLPTLMEYLGLTQKAQIFLADTDQETNKVIQYILAFLRLLSVIILPIGLNLILKKRTYIYSIDKIIITFNWFSLFIAPLLYISHDLYRLLYVIVIMNFCMASHYMKYDKCYYYTLFCSINIGYWFIWRPYFKEVFLDIFTNNFIF